jgi:hypothetical protein
MNLALILQVIVALPKIFQMIGNLIKTIQNNKEESKRIGFESAMANKPSSKDEAKKKIEEINSNLP